MYKQRLDCIVTLKLITKLFHFFSITHLIERNFMEYIKYNEHFDQSNLEKILANVKKEFGF